ncbi:MAG: FGGY-family carbohydrate kinase, partial [Acidimicrobiia bacterium]
DELRAQGARLSEITGLSLDPYFSAPTMRWLRDQLGPGPRIATSDTWLVQNLCGAFVTDASTASRSLLLDLDTLEWSAEACDIFGVDRASLPAVVDNDAIVGMTGAFGGAVPVTGLCVDQQAALWAQGCAQAGDAKCTYGTGAFLLASTGSRPVRSANGLVACVAWRLDGEPSWCLDGQVYTVGSAVSWLERMGFIDSPSDLDRIGGSVDSSNGVVFVPALAGLGAPFWAPGARGSLTGLSLSCERAHVVHAVVDGIAAQVAWLCRAVESDLGVPLTALRVDGGLTRSRLLLQLQADLAQIPIEVHSSRNATALGVAALAARALGGPASVAPSKPAEIIDPSISAVEATERLARWCQAADAAVVMSHDR